MKKTKAGEVNKVLLGDCRSFMKESLAYDYVFTVPPDYAEIKMDPINDQKAYNIFLLDVFKRLEPSLGIVTVSLTDRKAHSQIIPKHAMVISIMTKLGYRLISQKIWVKTMKQNLFRMTYSFVLTFANTKRPRQHRPESYLPDVWEVPNVVNKDFRDSMNPAIVKRCLLNFTMAGDIVFDPFMGTASTAVAALATGRKYLGCEIVEKVWNIGENRLEDAKRDRNFIFDE
ncbi:hypothetical protein LCGC14_1872870 [marine sediment metagenome]|uniref:DNA methylase N-4/N-6 domain-containing protein n=1 Tax=marine sediment metagenome TaxID=412755 RepID=A0A0F9J377_9ZZZZ